MYDNIIFLDHAKGGEHNYGGRHASTLTRRYSNNQLRDHAPLDLIAAGHHPAITVITPPNIIVLQKGIDFYKTYFDTQSNSSNKPSFPLSECLY